MMLPARAGHAESALKIRSFFPLHVIFLLINQYLISAQGKGNLVCSLGGLPKKKGFPLHGAKQVRSCLTAEDTLTTPLTSVCSLALAQSASNMVLKPLSVSLPGPLLRKVLA